MLIPMICCCFGDRQSMMVFCRYSPSSICFGSCLSWLKCLKRFPILYENDDSLSIRSTHHLHHNLFMTIIHLCVLSNTKIFSVLQLLIQSCIQGSSLFHQQTLQVHSLNYKLILIIDPSIFLWLLLPLLEWMKA